MRSPHSFIVKPVGGERYSTARSGIEMSASLEEAKFTNRYADVIQLPIGYEGPIQIGSVVITHHNIFRVSRNMLGEFEEPGSHIKEGTFFIQEDQIYMYQNTNSEWVANDPFIFVLPVDKIQDSFLLSTDQYETRHGVIKYAPDNSIVEPGDYIVFSKDSEYEFNIDDELLYRMKLSDVCLTLNKES